MSDPSVAEYESLFRKIAAWVTQDAVDIDNRVVTRDGIEFSETKHSPAGPFFMLKWKSLDDMLKVDSCVAYLRTNQIDGFGYMRRCDIQGSGPRDIRYVDYIPMLRTLRDSIVVDERAKMKRMEEHCVMSDPSVAEYESLFRWIAAWVTPNVGDVGYHAVTRGKIEFREMKHSPAGPYLMLMWKPIDDMLKVDSCVAYLRPDNQEGFGFLKRCDLRGGGHREWPPGDYVPMLRALRDSIVVKDPEATSNVVASTATVSTSTSDSEKQVDVAILAGMLDDLTRATTVVARCLTAGVDGPNRAALEREMSTLQARLDIAMGRFS